MVNNKGETLLRLQREFTKATMKQYLQVYVDELEANGFGRPNWEYLVAHNMSFTQHIMPPLLKDKLLDLLGKHQGEMADPHNIQKWVVLFVEVMGEIREWFPQVLTRAYMEQETRVLLSEVRRRYGWT